MSRNLTKDHLWPLRRTQLGNATVRPRFTRPTENGFRDANMNVWISVQIAKQA